MLAVCRVLASLRYNDELLLTYFGAKMKMMEFPAIRDLVAEEKQESRKEATLKTRQKDIMRFLVWRFGPQAASVTEAVEAVGEEHKLEALLSSALESATLQAFQEAMG